MLGKDSLAAQGSMCPPTCLIPGSATVPPRSQVVFFDNLPTPVPGTPRPSMGGRRMVAVTNGSPHTAMVSFDGHTLMVRVPPGLMVAVTYTLSASCTPVADQPNVLECSSGSANFSVNFTTEAPAAGGMAALDLAEQRPCIPEPGQPVCDPVRSSLWNGDASAWTARGVTDPDARFNETVVFRVRAGDPAAIANIARILGWPYLKVTRVRFTGDEFVEVTNLGGGAQDVTGWTLRSPERATVYRLPAGVTLQPGQVCTLHTTTGPPPLNPGGVCRFFTNTPDVWPDDAGEIVLRYDALDLLADATRYSANPSEQPPPPHLQLIPSSE